MYYTVFRQRQKSLWLNGGVPKKVEIRNESKSHPEPVEGRLLRPCYTLEIPLRQAQDDFSLHANEPLQNPTVFGTLPLVLEALIF